MLLLPGRICPPAPPPQKKKKKYIYIYMTLCVIGRVRLERNCGKKYNRHLFPYGGLALWQLTDTISF